MATFWCDVTMCQWLVFEIAWVCAPSHNQATNSHGHLWAYSELYSPDDCWVQLTGVQVNEAKGDGDGKLSCHTQNNSQNFKVLQQNKRKEGKERKENKLKGTKF